MAAAFAALTAAAGDGAAFDCFPADVKTVGVVMPASILSKGRFDEGVAALKRAGVNVKLAPRLDFKKRAPAADRAADFQEMWMDPEVDLVLCARGGQGSEDILPLLDWDKLRTRNGQRVLGFSNITMILNAMLLKGAGHPVSGPSISQMLYAKGDTFDWLKKTVSGAPLPPAKLRALVPGAFSGLPCGGHIALVKKGIGTGWACNPAGRVVFLERNASATVAELERELDVIASSGWLKDCAGVIFGDVTPKRVKGESAAEAREKVEAAKLAFAGRIGRPVYDGYSYGHIPVSHAIDFQRKVSVSEDGTVAWADVVKGGVK